jgi:hypothetical protein
MKAIFRDGETLKLILDYFIARPDKTYKEISNLLLERIKRYYT